MSTLAELQSPRAQMVNFKAGEPFPPLVLPNLRTGDELSLAEFHGQKILLHIFASW
jgi:hypothetical protein